MTKLKQEDFMVKHYSQLLGKTVQNLLVDNLADNGPCFGLKFTDGTKAWIMCDPEGNGPGHLDITDAPKAKKTFRRYADNRGSLTVDVIEWTGADGKKFTTACDNVKDIKALIQKLGESGYEEA